jgi:hypothetical protein
METTQDQERIQETRKSLKQLRHLASCRDFSQAQLGDFVYHDSFIGKVCELRHGDPLPIVVDLGFARRAFSRDGRMHLGDCEQSLFKCNMYILGLGQRFTMK